MGLSSARYPGGYFPVLISTAFTGCAGLGLQPHRRAQRKVKGTTLGGSFRSGVAAADLLVLGPGGCHFTQRLHDVWGQGTLCRSEGCTALAHECGLAARRQRRRCARLSDLLLHAYIGDICRRYLPPYFSLLGATSGKQGQQMKIIALAAWQGSVRSHVPIRTHPETHKNVPIDGGTTMPKHRVPAMVHDP